jgi:hypothetical protein
MKKLILLLGCILSAVGIAQAQLPSPACNAVIQSQGIITGWSCPAGGTVTQGYYVKLNTSGQVVNGATTDTAGLIVGIAGNSATTAGQSVLVFTTGFSAAYFDGATTQGHYCGPSSSTGGLLHDVGANGNTQSWCKIVVANSSTPYGTEIQIFGHIPEGVPSSAATTCPTIAGANNYIWNTNGSATAFGCTLPTAIGISTLQVCVGNSATPGRTASTGIVTVTAASGDYIVNKSGTFGSSGGTEVSGGAAADLGCFVSTQANQWQFIPVFGTWTP